MSTIPSDFLSSTTLLPPSSSIQTQEDTLQNESNLGSTKSKESSSPNLEGNLSRLFQKFSPNTLALGAYEGIKYATTVNYALRAGAYFFRLIDYSAKKAELHQYKRELGDSLSNLYLSGLFSAVKTEIIGREFLQNLCLYQIPKFIAKKISPGSETIFDSKMAKQIRIVLTAALWQTAYAVAFRQLDQKNLFSLRDVANFLSHLVFASIYEEHGLGASIAASATHRFMVHNAYVWKYSLHKDTRTLAQKAWDWILPIKQAVIG